MSKSVLLTVVLCFIFVSLISGSPRQDGSTVTNEGPFLVKAPFKPVTSNGTLNFAEVMEATQQVLFSEVYENELTYFAEREGLSKCQDESYYGEHETETGVQKRQKRGFFKKFFKKLGGFLKRVIVFLASTCSVSGSFGQSKGGSQWSLNCGKPK